MLNATVLVASLVGALLIGGIAYVIHSVQLQKLGVAFSVRSKQLEKDGKFASAAEYLHQYLEIYPNDVEARVRLAKVFEKTVGANPMLLQRAAELYVDAIDAAPKDKSLPIRLAETRLKMGSFKDARKDCEKILAADEDNADAVRVKGLAMYGEYRESGNTDLSAAVSELQRAQQMLKEKDVQLAVTLADIYRRKPIPGDRDALNKLADAAIAELVSVKTAEACLARREYNIKWHADTYDADAALNDAELAIDFSEQSGAANPQALAAAGVSAAAAGRRDKAKVFFAKLIKLEPSNPAGHVGLARVQIQEGRFKEADDTLTNGLKTTGFQQFMVAALLTELRIAHGDEKDMQEAIEVLDQSRPKLRPRVADVDKPTVDGMTAVLKAQFALKKKNYAGAIPYLKTAADLADRGEVGIDKLGISRANTWRLIGSAYSQLAVWDLAANAFDKSHAYDSTTTNSQLAAGRCWLEAGRPDLAHSRLKAAAEQSASAEDWMSAAQAAWAWHLTGSEGSTALANVQEGIAKVLALRATEPLAEPWRLDVLALRFKSAAGAQPRTAADPVSRSPAPDEKSLTELRRCEEINAENLGFWREAALLYEHWRMPTEADRCLARMFAIDPASAEPSLVKARMLMNRSQLDEAEDVLKKAIAELPVSVRRTPQVLLSEVLKRQGDFAGAKALLDQIDGEKDNPFGIIVRKLELAFDAKDWKECKKLERELKALESETGCMWRSFEVRRELAQSEEDSVAGKAIDLRKVEKNLNSLARERLNWPPVHLLRGSLYHRQGKEREAIAAYERAIQLGERRLQVYERLIALLYAEKEFSRASDYLRQVGSLASASQSLSALAISVATQDERQDDAMAEARRGVEERPNDCMAHVWLGNLLLARGEHEPALAAFQRAVDLAPTDARSWNGLFFYHHRRGDMDAAREVLTKMVAQVSLTEAQKLFVQAQGLDRLGDSAEALTYYRRAADVEPKNANLRLALAGALMKVDINEAEKELHLVRDLDPKLGGARRALAAIYAAGEDDERWKQAIALLKDDNADVESAALSKRLLAMLHVRRKGKENLAEAEAILRQLVREKGDVRDRVLLARVFQAQNKWIEAEGVYDFLVSGDKPSPDHLNEYCDMLIRRGSLDKAAVRLKDLEAAEPPDVRSFHTVKLRARYVHATGDAEGAAKLVEEFADRELSRLAASGGSNDQAPGQTADEQRLALMKETGDLYFKLAMYSNAEGWYRRRAKERPDEVMGLIQALARQGKITEAVSLADAAMKSERSATPVAALVSSWAGAVPVPPADQAAEKLLSSALTTFPRDIDLKFAIGNLRIIQERSSEAAELFEEVLAENPKHVAALNNLAMMYAESESPSDVDKALPLIAKAISLAGPAPALLDTQGMVLVHKGKSNEALPILRQAAGASTDPRFSFHLAIAFYELKENERAAAAFREALQNRLESEVLTRSEREYLEKLRGELNSRPAISQTKPGAA